MHVDTSSRATTVSPFAAGSLAFPASIRSFGCHHVQEATSPYGCYLPSLAPPVHSPLGHQSHVSEFTSDFMSFLKFLQWLTVPHRMKALGSQLFPLDVSPYLWAFSPYSLEMPACRSCHPVHYSCIPATRHTPASALDSAPSLTCFF